MMQRLVVFLILLLPIQFSWAAVSAYCEHETKAASHHIGHHQHKHQNAPSPTGDNSDTESKSDNFDADCGVCHAACSVVVCGKIAALNFVGSDVVFPRLRTSHTSSYAVQQHNAMFLRI